MGELRQIPFDVVYGVLGGIISMSDHGDHEAKVFYHPDDGSKYVSCTCDPKSPWRHHKGQTDEDIKATFNAHLSYFNKPRIQVL